MKKLFIIILLSYSTVQGQEWKDYLAQMELDRANITSNRYALDTVIYKSPTCTIYKWKLTTALSYVDTTMFILGDVTRIASGIKRTKPKRRAYPSTVTSYYYDLSDTGWWSRTVTVSEKIARKYFDNNGKLLPKYENMLVVDLIDPDQKISKYKYSTNRP